VDRAGVDSEISRSTQRKSRRQSGALPTLAPSERRRLVFDGGAYLQYDLQGLPDDYRRPNVYEQIRIKFQTDAPNGLLWYIGSQHANTHLSLKVRSLRIDCSMHELTLTTRLTWEITQANS